MDPDHAMQKLRELQAKVQEGENAKRQLQELILAAQNQLAGLSPAHPTVQASPRSTAVAPNQPPPPVYQQPLHQQPGPSQFLPPPNPQRHFDVTLPLPMGNSGGAQVQPYNQSYNAPTQVQNRAYRPYQPRDPIPTARAMDSNLQNGAPSNPLSQVAQNQPSLPTHNNSAMRWQEQANQMANQSYSFMPYAPLGQSASAPRPRQLYQQSSVAPAPIPPVAYPLQTIEIPPPRQQQTHATPTRLPPATTSNNHYRTKTASSTSKPPAPQPPRPSGQGSHPPLENRERDVPLKSMTQAEFDDFKARIFSWAATASDNDFVDLFRNFEFGANYVIVKYPKGLFVVDPRDNMKCPFSALVNALEVRKIPPPVASGSNSVQQSRPPTGSNGHPIEPRALQLTRTAAPSPVVQPQSSEGTGATLTDRWGTAPQPQKSTTIPIAHTTPRAPADANKQTLARDILQALGKRPRTTESTSEPAPKRTTAIHNLVGRETSNHYPSLPRVPSVPAIAAFPQQNLSLVSTVSEVTHSRIASLPLSIPSIQADSQSVPALPAAPIATPRPRLPLPPPPPQPQLVDEANVEVVSNASSLPPIATIDEVVSSRASTPVRAPMSSRSPSVVESEVAHPPISSSPNTAVPPPTSSRPPSVALESHGSSSTGRGVRAVMSIDGRAETPEEALFLPSNSPLSSPSLSLAGDIAASPSFSNEHRGRIRGKGKQRAYVLIPPPSPRTARAMRIQPVPPQDRSRTSRSSASRPSSRASRGTVVPEGSALDIWTSVVEEEEYDYSFDAQGNKIEDLSERALMETACTRLQPLPCKWDRCDVTMNSVISLLRHLKKQHQPTLKNESGRAFSCKWHLCGKQCRYGDRHFIKHALDYLTCPYIDCEERFRTVGQLRRHADKHVDNLGLKPSSVPFHPKPLAPPPDAPGILPAYMVVSRQVKAASITPGRQANLYPWVLKNIAGLVKVQQPRQRRGRTLRGLTANGAPDDSTFDRYAFLTDYPTRYSVYLSEPGGVRVDDIPENPDISELSAAGGLTILEPGTTEATILFPVKEESREVSPLLASDRDVSPEVPYGAMMVEEGEESEEYELLVQDADDDESDAVATMLL